MSMADQRTAAPVPDPGSAPASARPVPPWTLGLSIGVERITAATWTPAGVEELRLDGAVTTPAALGAGDVSAAGTGFAEVLDWFVTLGRHRYQDQSPAAVTVVLAWDGESVAYAAADRVLARMMPATVRRVIAAPPGSLGSPGRGEDPEPARVVARLAGEVVVAAASATAAPAAAAPAAAATAEATAGPAPEPGRHRRTVPLPVFGAVVAALVVALLAFLPLRQRYASEHQSRADAERQLVTAQARLAGLDYNLTDAGAASLNGKYQLSLTNTSCVGFEKDSCLPVAIELTVASCSSATCLTSVSSTQAFSGVKARTTTSGLQVTGTATGYTCAGDRIDTATYTLNVWPVGARYDAGASSWKATNLGATLVIETHGSGCDIGLLSWSGASSGTSS